MIHGLWLDGDVMSSSENSLRRVHWVRLVAVEEYRLPSLALLWYCPHQVTIVVPFKGGTGPGF